MKPHWNKKVAANRGSEWRQKLLAGRLDIQMNPSNIRLKRIKSNKTQIELAESVGISHATYGAIESGRRMVKADKAEKIAKALGIVLNKAFKAKTKNKFEAIRND